MKPVGWSTEKNIRLKAERGVSFEEVLSAMSNGGLLVVLDHPNTDQYLRIVLVVVGLTFTFGIWPLTMVWPSGWSWHAEGRSYYLEMILAIYATLGVFLMLAARNPLAHRSLIWFAVWSSIVHGGVMAVQSFDGDHNMGHLWGDVLALFAVAAVLALLTPREAKAEAP